MQKSQIYPLATVKNLTVLPCYWTPSQSSLNLSGTKTSSFQTRPVCYGNIPQWQFWGFTQDEKMPLAFPSPYLISPAQIRITPTAHLRLREQFQWGLWSIWSSKTSRITWDLQLMPDTSSVTCLRQNLQFWMIPKVQLQQSFLRAEQLALVWRATKTGRVFFYGKNSIHKEGDLTEGWGSLSIPPATRPFSPTKILCLLPMTKHHCQKDF